MQFQLKFDRSNEFNSQDYLVSSSNNQAYEFITSWPEWKIGYCPNILIISGPNQCGKTYLAHIWSKLSGAIFLDPVMVNQKDISDYIHESKCFVIEDVNQCLYEEIKLFHLINYAMQNKIYLVITTDGSFAGKLLDLKSRLKSFNLVEILLPDEELITLLLYKKFSDRQMKISPEVINFLVKRIERSYSSVEKIVDIIDKKSLDEKRNITIPFITKVFHDENI